MNKRKIKKALKRIIFLPKNKYLLLYVFNKMKHYYLKLTHSTKVAYPSTIMLELTNHCNLACTICPREYEYGKSMDKGAMPVQQAKDIIDELWPYLDSIGLTGMGETFIYKDLTEVVNYIKSKNKGIIISVSTNAVLPGFLKKVKPLINIIDTIQISIDGINEVYESIRINSTFNVLDKNLKALIKMCTNSDTTLMLNMVVTKENYKHMPLLVDYTAEIGIKYLDFTIFNLASVTNIDISYYKFYSSNEFNIALEALNDKIQEHKEVQVVNRNFKTDSGFNNCPFPWRHFYITWDGYVPPCCAKPFPKELNFGNVFDTKAMTIFNSTEFREFRTLWFNNRTPDFCKNCHFVAAAQSE